MRTRLIPALVTLLACAVVCVNSFVAGYSFSLFAKFFIIAAIVFYIIGVVVKIIVEKGYEAMSDSLTDMQEYDMDEDLIDNEYSYNNQNDDDFEDLSE